MRYHSYIGVAYMVKVSVTIPVYNVEKYLRECLDSLLGQTLEDIELICINDGSTDSSLEILQEYANKDERIKIFDKENEGQGVGRNIGIKNATGEFISFVNPDDWVELDMYEKMYNQAKELNSQVVFCDYKKIQEWDGKSSRPKIFKKAVSLTKSEPIKVPVGQNIKKPILYSSFLVAPCYTKNGIYETSMIKENSIRYADFRSYEDIMFLVRTIVLAQNISYINSPLYNYRIKKFSTIKANEERYIDLINITKAVKDYLLNQGLMDDFESNFEYFCVSNIYRVYLSLTSEDYKRNLLELSEEVLDEHLLAELQKKILCSFSVWKKLLLNPKNYKQQLENDFYLRKYLNR